MDKDIKVKIEGILRNHLDSTYTTFIFGSRADGSAQKYSDFDIGIQGKEELSGMLIESIREDFHNSDLPIFVDVVDFSVVDEQFKNVALQQKIMLDLSVR